MTACAVQGGNPVPVLVKTPASDKSVQPSTSFSGSNIKRVVLVLFGDHIASIVRRQGYKVIQIPENVKKEELKQAHKTKAKKIADDSKELAQIILEEQLQKGLDYLKNEKNREKIVDEGAAVVKLVFQIWKKPQNDGMI